MSPKQVEQLRQDAIDKLADKGAWVSRTSTIDAICQQIAKLTGNEKRARQRKTDYIGRWLEEGRPMVAAPYRPPFRQMTPKPHPRLADIQRAQPPLITPDGIGNYKQQGGFAPMVWR